MLNVSAYDLSRWHDLNWGASPFVLSVQNQCPSSVTMQQVEDTGKVVSACGASTAATSTLVHECEYTVELSYQDVLLHEPGVHTLQRYTVEFDYVTL